MSERVPEGWTKTRLSEFSSARRGTTYVASELSEDKERYPLYINMKSFKVGGGYNERGDKYFSSPYSPGQIVRENDLLIANTDVTDACDILGAAVYLPREKLLEDVLFSHHVSALNIADDVDVNFLSFLFGSENSRLAMKRCGRGTTVKMLDMKDIGRICFSIPPLPEQKKIASILTSVDEVIETTQKQIDKLQDLKKATMNELLTKGIGHTEFKDSELGRIPKSWGVRTLSELTLKIGDGIHATPQYSDNGDFPFINGNNLVHGSIVFGQSTKRVDKGEFEKHETKLGAETILMSINGTIGNLAFYRGENVVLGKSAAYLTFSNDMALLFAYYLLGSTRVKQHFEDELTGTTIRNLSLKTIRNAPVVVPPLTEQAEISEVISSIDFSIEKIANKLAQTQSLKKSLMQDLLTGKVRVKVN
jgi:type I restriction enzyme S subunit